jgi:protein-L-isoaspartate(D-aspartate) O-methyltransferase
MIETQLRGRGITDAAVLRAFAQVPREAFVREVDRERAYDDRALPIQAGQTISQPYVIAWMLELLELVPGDKVLEVGAGSGYVAALLAHMGAQVYAIEYVPLLAEAARARLVTLGLEDVTLAQGDGTLGWPEHAPFDAILVSAGGPEVPKALLEQLVLGGRLVIPVGAHPRRQELVQVRRTGQDTYDREPKGPVQFVPLVGEAGWQ